MDADPYQIQTTTEIRSVLSIGTGFYTMYAWYWHRPIEAVNTTLYLTVEKEKKFPKQANCAENDMMFLGTFT